jgi:hypothetical protein
MKRAVVCVAATGSLLAGCSHPSYTLEIEATGPCQFGSGLTGPFFGTNHAEVQVLDPSGIVLRTAKMAVHTVTADDRVCAGFVKVSGVPKEELYQIRLKGESDEATYRFSQLEASGWRVTLEVPTLRLVAQRQSTVGGTGRVQGPADTPSSE